MSDSIQVKSSIGVLATVLSLALAFCTNDPIVEVKYRSGQTAEDVLRDLSRQREHLYVGVADAPSLGHRLSTDVAGRMPMSVFVKAFAQSAQVKAEYYPQEPNSPRGTLKISSGAFHAHEVYAIIRRGTIDTSK